MLSLALIALAQAPVFVPTQQPQPLIFLQPNRRRPLPSPAFVFAPSNGAGMGTACACVNPTSPTGQALTFTRASAGFCTKGNTTANIANGDLVSCGANLARVMPGGDGTGPLGLLVEPAFTNLLLRSQEIDNATWASFTADAGTATAAVKGPADVDVAPDNTQTSERVEFLATTATLASGLSQAIVTSTTGASIYARDYGLLDGGTQDGGVFDLCIDQADAGFGCVACSYVVGSWTRCLDERVNSKITGKYYIGNLSYINGGVARPLQTVSLWGGLASSLGYASMSYVATSGSTAAMSQDQASFPASLVPAGTSTTMSYSATWFRPFITTQSGILQCFKDGNTSERLETTALATTVQNSYRIAAAAHIQIAPGNMTNNAFSHVSGFYDGTNKAACLAGSCASSAETLSIATTGLTVYLGGTSTVSSGGVIRDVCVDANPGRCQ